MQVAHDQNIAKRAPDFRDGTNNFHMLFSSKLSQQAAAVAETWRQKLHPHWTNVQNERPELFKAVYEAMELFQRPMDVSTAPAGEDFLACLKQRQVARRTNEESLNKALRTLYNELLSRGADRAALWG